MHAFFQVQGSYFVFDMSEEEKPGNEASPPCSRLKIRKCLIIFLFIPG